MLAQRLAAFLFVRKAMLSLDECRKLCPSLEALPDAEVAKVRDTIYAMGQLALEDWERKNGGSKNLNWFLPLRENEVR